MIKSAIAIILAQLAIYFIFPTPWAIYFYGVQTGIGLTLLSHSYIYGAPK